MERHLGAGAHDQAVFFIEIRDADMRFDVHVLLLLGMILTLKNPVGFCKGFFHIADLRLDAVDDVMLAVMNTF